MSDDNILIVDYGLGNLFNLNRALDHLGRKAVISKDAAEILRADRLILPGVGAFAEAMRNLSVLGLTKSVKEFASSGRPVLGICLGMQLLMSQSQEYGQHAGLDLIPGDVVRLKEPTTRERRFTIPHIGWNSIEHPVPVAGADPWERTVLAGLPDNTYVYYLHSYVVQIREAKASIAVTSYGEDSFCAVLQKGNISGCQFHPERSGELGLHILNNFAQG